MPKKRKKLFLARLAKDISSEEMAEKVGCSYATYRRIEKGADLTIGRGLKICEVLGADFAEIFLSENVHGMNKGGSRCG